LILIYYYQLAIYLFDICLGFELAKERIRCRTSILRRISKARSGEADRANKANKVRFELAKERINVNMRKNISMWWK
jgi:hypothetical protein